MPVVITATGPGDAGSAAPPIIKMEAAFLFGGL